MSEFTQGKWEYAEYVPEDVTINGKEYIIFTGSINDPQDEGDDIALARREADARLIAAAPEMYKLLKFFCEDKAIDEDRFDDYLVAIFEAKKLFNSIDGDSQEV